MLHRRRHLIRKTEWSSRNRVGKKKRMKSEIKEPYPQPKSVTSLIAFRLDGKLKSLRTTACGDDGLTERCHFSSSNTAKERACEVIWGDSLD